MSTQKKQWDDENISRLTEALDSIGISDRKISERIGITSSGLSKIRKGMKPSDQTIMLLNYAFGISEEWLRVGKGEMFEEKEEVCEPSANYGSRSLEEEVYELKGKVELLTRFFTERGNFAA